MLYAGREHLVRSESPQGLDWETYFRERAAKLRAAEAKAQEPPAPAFRSIRGWTPLLDEDAPRTIKTLAKTLRGLDWANVQLFWSQTAHRDELYAGSTKDHDEGDVKKPAHTQTHYAIVAIDDLNTDDALAGHWTSEDVPEGEKAKPTKFNGGFTRSKGSSTYHPAITSMSNWAKEWSENG